MSPRWLTVLLVLTAACGSQRDHHAGIADSANATVITEPTQVTARTSATTVAPSTQTAQVTPSTTLGVIYKQVEFEATLPPLDGPATLWRVPSLPADPQRLARWARAFGFTDNEIATATGTRIARNTPDGQVLNISEPTGQWMFVDGPAGMFALPGSCPLPAVAPPSTTLSQPPVSLPPGQLCTEPTPPGIPDPPAAELQARSLWQALGIDLTGVNVIVRGDENLREVIASDELDGVIVARLRVVIGSDARVLRATGSVDAPVEAGSVPRLGVIEALNRFARQPPSAGPDTSPPASFDGIYRVTGATAGLTTWGGQWLIPSYDVTLADGRTIPLFAIDQADIPAG